MKKFIALAVLSVFTVFSANAQYRGSHRGGYQRSAPAPTRHIRSLDLGYGYNRPYFGLRVGPSFSNISGDECVGGTMKTGVNAGMAIGFPLSGFMPLYLETGLYYNEKGEGKDRTGLKYNVSYLELPFVFKYQHYFDNHASIQPYFGGYAALGVAGKTTDPNSRYSWSSFGDDGKFRRGDAGLRFGCGLSYDMFYAEVNYDWGLSNISKSNYNESKNNTLTLNLGINF